MKGNATSLGMLMLTQLNPHELSISSSEHTSDPSVMIPDRADPAEDARISPVDLRIQRRARRSELLNRF